MFSTMHFRALRNRGSPSYHFVNKALMFRRFLCLSKNFISLSFATSNNRKISFQIIKNKCHFDRIRKMSTARLAGKKIDDVLYPNIEPYKTGMLKVSNLRYSHERFYYINSINWCYSKLTWNNWDVHISFIIRLVICIQFTGNAMEIHPANR